MPAAANPATLSTSCQRHLPEDVNAAIPICEEEHVVIIVPGNLVHLKLELLLSFGTMRLGINEGDYIILVPHCNGLSIRAPADVDVLSWRDRKAVGLISTQQYTVAKELSRQATFIPDPCVQSAPLTQNHSQRQTGL